MSGAPDPAASAARPALPPALDRMLRRFLTPVIVLAALTGLVLLLRDEGPAAARAFARAEAVPLLAASVAVYLAGLLLAVHAWRVLVPGEHGVKGLTAARIFFLGQLSKYVPGRIWGLLTHVTQGRAAGVPGARMTSAYVLTLALTVLTGAGVSLLAAPAALPGHWPWLLLPALCFLACVVRPALATRPVTALLRLFRQTVEPPSDRAVRRAILLAVASWLISGLHLWFLVLALDGPLWSGLTTAVGAFALAAVVSSLAVIVPDGWGVRELTITAALSTVLPAGTAATAAIASRVVCVVAELGSSAVVLAWARLRRRAAHPTAQPAPTPMGEPRVHP
ncbi:lysylphosphatidylglycerol synthase domain-containing protein [Streptomyces sp. NPDC020141]|uniref:lysylphosphatidylglycerol synthase domain-containing protein n=1 Tax=Streptomyces sp. NPDC020141 TaxID=3365065 RepID=UPI0037BDD66C